MEKVLSDVRILPLSALRLHEMTQRELTNRIKGMIRASRTARSPIIVERKSRVVLDGMHRVEAFLELGYRNILCQLVDYDAPGLLVGAWFPTFDAREPMQEVAKLAETKPVALATGMRMLKTSKAAFLLAYSEKGRRKFALVAPSARRFSTEGLVRAQYSLIRKLSARHAMSYVPDYEWEEHKGAILLRRSFSKGEVLAMARKGVLFPPKATRHCFPLRVLNVNMPLSWLKLAPSEGNKKLQKMLRQSATLNEMRHYPESVLVVDDARFA